MLDEDSLLKVVEEIRVPSVIAKEAISRGLVQSLGERANEYYFRLEHDVLHLHSESDENVQVTALRNFCLFDDSVPYLEDVTSLVDVMTYDDWTFANRQLRWEYQVMHRKGPIGMNPEEVREAKLLLLVNRVRLANPEDIRIYQG